MFARTLAVVILVLLAPLPLTGRTGEKVGPSPRIELTRGWAGGNGQKDHVGLNGVLLLVGNRPIACFGMRATTGEKGKYIYIILFKNGPAGFPSKDSFYAADGSGNEGEFFEKTKSTVTIMLGGKKLQLAYNHERDPKSYELKSEMLKLGETEIKENNPRVFLVDLAQEKITYRPVQVKLPEVVPAFPPPKQVDDKKSEQYKAWPAMLMQTVEQLKKNSPEIKKFMAP
jgi:hypothetical protein